MNSKTMSAILAAALPAVSFAATPEVTGVTMTQATSSRLVTIEYTIDAPAVVTLDVETNANTSAAADDPGWTSIGGEAVCNAQGDVWKQVAAGIRTITWRPDLSWPDHKIANGGARAVVTAWALDNTPDYMVVDIAAGAQPNTQKYYPAVEFLPGGLLTNDAYRKSMIVMRKIMAKDVTWTMGSTSFETVGREAAREATHQVTLTNNYYIGVFEVTQGQWLLIKDTKPAAYTLEDREVHPVEQVSYNTIRNSADTTYNWPHEPHESSFLGLLHTRTGIWFDLPSEAQWEFAARAGHGDTLWGDGSSILGGNQDYNPNLNLLGRYIGNSGGTTAAVGSYNPNSWGLYDMHGNVLEWCLDWYEENIATATDASGKLYGGRVNIDPSNSQAFLSGAAVPSGATRVMRGGRYDYNVGYCRPANRSLDRTPGTAYQFQGFRLVCTAGLQ